MKVVTLEVVGLGRFPLRMTECGAKPYGNGDKVKVSADISGRMLELYRPFLKQITQVEEVDSLANGHWEALSVVAQDAAPTEDVPKKSDKSMAGKKSVKKA